MFGIKKIFIPKLLLNRIIMNYHICLKIYHTKRYNHIRKEIREPIPNPSFLKSYDNVKKDNLESLRLLY